MERLKKINNCLMAQVESQMTHLDAVDTCELGAAIDMIKDLEEAIYYKTIVEAMHANDTQYYSTILHPTPDWHDNSQEPFSSKTTMPTYPLHDIREGHSYKQRKMYMESKELHHPKEQQLKELESYMQELTSDIMEMIKEASPEEKSLLQKKIAILATKINV